MASLPARELSVRENAPLAGSDSRLLPLADVTRCRAPVRTAARARAASSVDLPPATDLAQAPPLRGVEHEVSADRDGDPCGDEDHADEGIDEQQNEADHPDGDGCLRRTGHLCLLLCG